MESAEDLSQWVEILSGDYPEGQIIPALHAAEEIKYNLDVSKGLTIMMGVASLLTVRRISIESSEIVIQWAENPQFGVAVNSIYLAGAYSISRIFKAGSLEKKANPIYKEIKARTSYSASKMSKLLSDLYKHELAKKVDRQESI